MGQKVNPIAYRLGILPTNDWNLKYNEKNITESSAYFIKIFLLKNYIKDFLYKNKLALHQCNIAFSNSNLHLSFSYSILDNFPFKKNFNSIKLNDNLALKKLNKSLSLKGLNDNLLMEELSLILKELNENLVLEELDKISVLKKLRKSLSLKRLDKNLALELDRSLILKKLRKSLILKKLNKISVLKKLNKSLIFKKNYKKSNNNLKKLFVIIIKLVQIIYKIIKKQTNKQINIELKSQILKKLLSLKKFKTELILMKCKYLKIKIVNLKKKINKKKSNFKKVIEKKSRILFKNSIYKKLKRTQTLFYSFSSKPYLYYSYNKKCNNLFLKSLKKNNRKLYNARLKRSTAKSIVCTLKSSPMFFNFSRTQKIYYKMLKTKKIKYRYLIYSKSSVRLDKLKKNLANFFCYRSITPYLFAVNLYDRKNLRESNIYFNVIKKDSIFKKNDDLARSLTISRFDPLKKKQIKTNESKSLFLKTYNFKKKIFFFKLYKIIKHLKTNNFVKYFIKALKKYIGKKRFIYLTMHQVNSVSYVPPVFLSKNMKTSYSMNILSNISFQLQRYKEYTFFESTLATVLIALTRQKSAELLANFIATTLPKIGKTVRHRFYLQFIENIIKEFFKLTDFSFIRGIQITTCGRVNKVPRKQVHTISIGKISKQQINLNIDHAQAVAQTRANGSLGIEIWINYWGKIEKGNYKKKVTKQNYIHKILKKLQKN